MIAPKSSMIASVSKKSLSPLGTRSPKSVKIPNAKSDIGC